MNSQVLCSYLIFLICSNFQIIQASTYEHLASRNELKAQLKIVNGSEAQWEGTRHQVSIRLKLSDLFFGAGHICGGSLIAPNIILTAGHCIWNYVTNRFRDASDYSVVLGNLNRYRRDKNTLVFSVINITVHPNYNATTYDGDVAVLHLNDSVPMNFTRAHVIALNDEMETRSGKSCQVSGWGRNEDGKYPPQLIHVDVAIIDRSLCSLNYGAFVRESMLCAGYMLGGRDACVGDSGGPLTCAGKLVGVVSFGVGCAQPGFPGVYANVANYAAWIKNVTRSLLGDDTHADTDAAAAGDDVAATESSSNVSSIVVGVEAANVSSQATEANVSAVDGVSHQNGKMEAVVVLLIFSKIC